MKNSQQRFNTWFELTIFRKTGPIDYGLYYKSDDGLYTLDDRLFTDTILGYTYLMMGYNAPDDELFTLMIRWPIHMMIGYTHLTMDYMHLMKGYTHMIIGYTYLMIGYNASDDGLYT